MESRPMTNLQVLGNPGPGSVQLSSLQKPNSSNVSSDSDLTPDTTTKLLVTPTATTPVGSSPSRGVHFTSVTDDSGNFSEVTDLGDTSPLPAGLNVNGKCVELPFFSIGSPCLQLNRTSSTNLNSPYSVAAAMSSSSVIKNELPEISVHSQSCEGGLSLPNIKFNGIDNPNIHACKSDSYLGLLAENFHAFYKQKLIDIEKDASGDQETYVVKRNSVLKDWINDLIEQNQVLIETVDEMEHEAAAKIIHLDSKVYQSSQMAAKHMAIIQEYEQQVQHLLAQRASFEEKAGELRSDVTGLKNKNCILEEKLNSLESENEKLVTLITRIRDWGVWDISDIHFNQRTYYRIFELYPTLAGSEVQTVFTKERAKEVQKTEQQLDDLKITLQNLQDFKINAEESLNEKDILIFDYQKEVNELREKLRICMDENSEYRRSLEGARHLLQQMSMRSDTSTPRTSYSNQNSGCTNFTYKDHEMSEMLNELRDLKSQLSIACTERQNAVLEANSLKSEMNERLEEVEHMKGVLINIQNEAQHTRSKVQDVQERQDQLVTLKEQVHSYQQKYEEARDMLNSKGDTIQNLQRQMDLLNEKVVKIENTKSRTRTPTSSIPKVDLKEKTTNDLHPGSQEIQKQSSNINHLSQPIVEMEMGLEKSCSRSKSRLSAEKPPWNEHFIKGSLDQDQFMSDDVSGRKHENHSLSTRKSSVVLVQERHERRRQQALKHDFMENHRKINARLLEQKKYSSKKKENIQKCLKEPACVDLDSLKPSCVSTNSVQYSGKTFSSEAASSRYQKVAQYFSDRFGIALDGNITERSLQTSNIISTPESVKLPPINTSKSGRNIGSRDSKKSKTEKPSSENQPNRLPRLVELPKMKPDKNYVGSGCKTLDALVNEAVRASKQMIESFDPSKGKMSMRVRASHRHHHRRTTEVNDNIHHRENNSEATKFYGIRKGTLRTPTEETDIPLKTLFKAEGRKSKNVDVIKEIKRQCSYRKNKKSGSETDPSLKAIRHVTQCRPNTATSILATLPSESQEYLVQNWIYKNASTGTLPDDDISEDQVELETGKIEVNLKNNTCHLNQESISSKYKGLKANHHHSLTHKKYQTEKQQPQSHKVSKVKPERNGHLPSKGILKHYKTDAECELAYYTSHNGILNNNTEPPPGNYLVSNQNEIDDAGSWQILQEKISFLESQCATKEKLLSNLHCELQIEKSARENWKKTMDSKDAEITMQKDHKYFATNSNQPGKSDNTSSTPLQECLLRNYKEILKQEEELVSMKSENDFLSLRTELLEKNVLLYKSYVVLGAIEPDYSHGDFQHGFQTFGNTTTTTNDEQFEMDYLIHEQIADLKRFQTENQELNAKLELEILNIRKLQNDLEGMAADKFSEMSLMATELEESIADLKNKNVHLNSELKYRTELEDSLRSQETSSSTLFENKEETIYLMKQIEKDLLDLAEKDEQIQIRNKQIVQYDEYVKRLHTELKDWAKYSEDDQLNSTGIQYSQTPLVKNNSRSKDKHNMGIEIEKMKKHLDKSQRREAELRCDNQMLKQTVSILSLKIEQLVKSFEFVQFEDTEQDHSPSLNSITVPPLNYDIPLVTSTPLKEKQGGLPHWQGGRMEFSTVVGKNNGFGSSSHENCGDTTSQNTKGISYASLMTSIRDLNNNSQEKRLQKIEQLIEQLKNYVMMEK